MKDRFLAIIKRRNATTGRFTGFADFLIHAPEKDKKAIIRKAAEKANADQLRVYSEAKLKPN